MTFKQFVDYFIPPENCDAGSDDYYKHRTVVVCSFAVLILILLFLANRIRMNGFLSIYSVTLMGAAIAISIVPFYLKMSGSYSDSNKLLFASLTLLIMILTYTTGGLLSSSLVFIPAFPFGGIVFVSFRFGIMLGMTFIGYLMFLVFAHSQGIVPAPTTSGLELAELHAATTIATSIIFAILARLYISWQEDMRKIVEEASRAKSEFLSGMSHELRTPLNSIIGFSDLLQRDLTGELNEKQRDYVCNIYSSGNHMLALINNLLDIAKIESGTVVASIEPVYLEALIDECLLMVADSADRKKVRIQTEIDDSCKGKIAYLDQLKIKQIILNLLSNAVKFSSEGSEIVQQASIIDNNIVVSVSDGGVGIPVEIGEKVFEKFYQVDSEVNGNLPGTGTGTGLGLAISRGLAELHDGTLELVPNGKNYGACFMLTIPFRNGEQAVRRNISTQANRRSSSEAIPTTIV